MWLCREPAAAGSLFLYQGRTRKNARHTLPWGYPTAMTPRPRGALDAATIGMIAVTVVLFWGDCLWGGRTPVAGVYQLPMHPWSASISVTEGRQWDSLLWDSVAQFYPWRLLLHRAGAAGELPLWNPYQFHGYSFVGNGQSAMFYPPNWVYFALHPGLAMGISAALHYLLGAWFVYGLARVLGLRAVAAAFSALAFVFGGFMVTWVELPTLVNSLVWLPLAWWGVEVLFRGRAARGALMLGLALGLTILAGHLQIAAYVWIFTALYALGSLAFRRGPKAERFAWLTGAAAIGGVLALVQLLPTLELGALSPRGAGGATAAGFAFHQQRALRPIELLTLLQPDFLGSPVSGDYVGISYSEHCGFVGATTLFLGLAGLWFGRRRKVTWALSAVAALALWSAMGGLPAALLYWGVPKLGQAGGFARLLSVWTLVAALCGGSGLEMVLRSCGRRATSGEQAWRRDSRYIGPVVAGLALVLLALELLPWAYRFNPRIEASKLYAETPLIARLRAETGDGRYLAVTPRSAWRLDRVPASAVLPPNAGTAYGLRSVGGYDSLFPAAYREYAAGLEGADPAPAANGNMLLLENARGWAEEVNCIVSALDAPTGLPGPGETLDGCTLWVAQRPPSSARAYALSAEGPGAPTPVPTRIIRDGLNAVTLEVAPAGARNVVLRDAPYPGWRAFADGRPADWQAGPSERRVVTPAGATRIDMVYFPATVIVGGFLSLLALSVLAALGCASCTAGGGQCR